MIYPLLHPHLLTVRFSVTFIFRFFALSTNGLRIVDALARVQVAGQDDKVRFFGIDDAIAKQWNKGIPRKTIDDAFAEMNATAHELHMLLSPRPKRPPIAALKAREDLRASC